MIVQNGPVDALSDVLRLIDAHTLCSVSLVAGGDWAIRFPMPDCLKFNAVRRGACWIIEEGSDSPQRLTAGDCFVARGGFILASSPELPPIPAETVFLGPGVDACYGDGDDVKLLGGSVRFDAADGAMLLDVLPRAMVISGGVGAAAPIGWLLEQLDREWLSGEAGSQLACNDLMRLMFINALRAYLAEPPHLGASWLAGLADGHIGRALRAIHADPARDWTLSELAELAGRSRSSFAAHFKERVGTPPIDYALRWRMRLAATRLRRTNEPVSTIAASLGYLSDSAFSATFRRIMGMSPTRYRAGSIRSTNGGRVEASSS